MNQIGKFFMDNGYYLARGVYSKAEVRRLEEEFDRIVRQLMDSREDINARWEGAQNEKLQAKDTVVLHTHNVHKYSRLWLDAFLQKSFLALAEEILGPDIVLHHSKLFQKPPEKGAPFPTHQDWSYFPTLKDTMIAAVIHVSKSTDEMGCLRVYPGSHKLGRVQGTAGMRGQDDSNTAFYDKYPLEGATPLEAGPGDVAFFHYLTIHGSKPNRSGEARKTVLVQMFSGHDRVEDGGWHPNDNLVLQGWNYEMNRKRAGG